MSARILVTGATGYLGKEVLRRYSLMGVEVRAAVHRTDHAVKELRSEMIETVPLDFTDKSLVENALEGVEIIVLITPAVSELSEYVRIMLDVAKSSSVSHVIKISPTSVKKVPMIKLSKWHREAEMLLEESGIDYTIVRHNCLMQYFFSCMQPTGGLIYLPLGKENVSFIDARDVAVAISEISMSLGNHRKRAYNLTGPQALSMFKATSIITEVISQHVEYADISEETTKHVMDGMGIPSWLSDLYLELYAFYRAGLACDVSEDFELITGGSSTTFLDFARDHADLFRNIVEHEEE
ncbi:hypothetical protein CHISP_2077 [Chitinispirillum alkaliphilum]|nr:hypothetical protein CHISP_2077 [Chitinispirillum alkaliphilum]